MLSVNSFIKCPNRKITYNNLSILTSDNTFVIMINNATVVTNISNYKIKICKVCTPDIVWLIHDKILMQEIRKQLMMYNFLIFRVLIARYVIKLHFAVHVLMNSVVRKMNIFSIKENLHKTVSEITTEFVIDLAKDIASVFFLLMIFFLSIF